MITLIPTLFSHPDGSLFIAYKPTFRSMTCLSEGELTFAVFHCAVGAPAAEHARVKAEARKSAISAFRLLAEQAA